ncbi:MAG: methyltransferase, FkbM family [Geminicoccaceae bacterium]|nr:methyltransferase, FkbM family [Geminicoccaceae bacterium]
MRQVHYGLEWWRLPSQAARIAGWRDLARRGRLLRYLVARGLATTGISRLLLIRRRDFVLRFYPSSISIALWVDRDGRNDDEDFFRRYLRRGDVVIDVGANIGNLTLQAAQCVGPSGRVIAVEPHPRTFAYLLGNLRLNGANNVDALNIALGERDEVVRFSSGRQDDQNAVVTGSTGLRIPVRPLDAVVPRDMRVALLKIDVEGYERFVLAGARETLRQSDCVFFEAYETAFARFGYAAGDLFALLRDAGFQLFRFDERREPIPLPEYYRAERCENLLAVRDVATAQARLARS